MTIQIPCICDLSCIFAGTREHQGNTALVGVVILIFAYVVYHSVLFFPLVPCKQDAVSALLERTSAELEAVEQELAEDEEEEDEQEQRGSEEDW